MDGYPRGFLHRPPYPCRYARADDAQLARGPGEVAAVAAQYEKRYTRHDQQVRVGTSHARGNICRVSL